jgi:hypothetical protein
VFEVYINPAEVKFPALILPDIPTPPTTTIVPVSIFVLTIFAFAYTRPLAVVYVR